MFGSKNIYIGLLTMYAKWFCSMSLLVPKMVSAWEWKYLKYGSVYGVGCHGRHPHVAQGRNSKTDQRGLVQWSRHSTIQPRASCCDWPSDRSSDACVALGTKRHRSAVVRMIAASKTASLASLRTAGRFRWLAGMQLQPANPNTYDSVCVSATPL